jgi:hypothetical protein
MFPRLALDCSFVCWCSWISRKVRQRAAVLFSFHFNGDSERRINTPPKFSGTRDPLCFFPDNNVLWTFTSIETDFAPNEWRH